MSYWHVYWRHFDGRNNCKTFCSLGDAFQFAQAIGNYDTTRLMEFPEYSAAECFEAGVLNPIDAIYLDYSDDRPFDEMEEFKNEVSGICD